MRTKLIHVSGEVHKLGGALEGQAKMIKDDRHITHREMQGRDQGQFKAIREGRNPKYIPRRGKAHSGDREHSG